MSFTWGGGDAPDHAPIGPLGGMRVALRAIAIMVVLLTGVILTCVLRPIEGMFRAAHRPLTAPITQAVSRLGLGILGLDYRKEGQPMRKGGAVVANHSSWLDILVLNAGQRVVFVSKAEVQSWPVIGLLARLAGTVFIRRDRREAKAQAEMFQDRIEAGQMLLFFPEGTSTDGMRVLPFKSTLFETFFADTLREMATVQPVSVVYEAPDGADPRYYGWWGDMDLGPHALKILAARRHGRVRVIYHAPVRVSAFEGRKALSSVLETQVRAGMPEGRQLDT